MKAYCVAYKVNGVWDDEKRISFLAHNKADAYDKAVYEIIPKIEGRVPYSAWVVSVTYNNGNEHFFNTLEGLAY